MLRGGEGGLHFEWPSDPDSEPACGKAFRPRPWGAIALTVPAQGAFGDPRAARQHGSGKKTNVFVWKKCEHQFKVCGSYFN